MKDVARGGRAVLFVSHHMQSVQVLCNRGMYLEHGQVKHIGSVAGAIEHYTASFAKADLTAADPDRRPGSGELRFSKVVPVKETFTCGETKTVEFAIKRCRPFVGRYFVSAHVVNELGAVLAQCDSRKVGVWFDAEATTDGSFSFRTPWLKPGRYRVEMFICSAGIMDRFEEACQLEVIPLLPYPAAGNEEATSNGLVFSDYAYNLDRHLAANQRAMLRV